MPQRTILVADDDPAIIKSLKTRCEAMGLRVWTAEDGFETNYTLSIGVDGRPAPDVIILDVCMPIDDGLGICETLVRDPALAHVPVVILTSKSDADTRRRCEELGAHYIHKSPDFWRKLQAKLEELMPATCAAASCDGA